MELLNLFVTIIIFLVSIKRFGDWFDFLQAEARYDNWWTNFQFASVFPIMGLCAAGIAMVCLVSAARPAPTPVFLPLNQNTVASGHGHSNSAHAAKTHKRHVGS